MQLTLVAISILLGLVGSAIAADEKRVALVVGNSAYLNVAPLANPVNDAKAVAASLERLGFEVILGLDLDHRSFVRHMKDYARQLQGAEVAVFFYAGHGLQVNGENYLAPVNTELVDELDLEFETVRLKSIIGQMEKEPRTSLIFLDACRNNPLARNLATSLGTRNVGTERGLAPVETGIGTLIAYSTQPGNVAFDGTAGHSPFSEALLEHMETPGADIAMVLRRVRQQVLSQTGGKQVPWSNSSLTGDVVLKTGLREDLREFMRLEEEAFWGSIKDASDPVVLENYLKRYPNGHYAEEARRKILDLVDVNRAEQERVAQLKAQAEQHAGNLLRAQSENEQLQLRLQEGTESHQARLDAARSQVEARERELAEMARQNSLLRERFDQSVRAHEQLLKEAEAQQARREQEVARLSEEKSRLKNEVQPQVKIRSSLETAIEDADMSAQETERIRAELTEIRSRSDQEITNQNQELALARAEIDKARSSAVSHQAELLKLQREKKASIAEYSQKLLQAEEERSALEKRLAALTSKNKELAIAESTNQSGIAGTGPMTESQNTVKSVHLDQAGRIALQMSLKEFGYDPGPADGNFGPQTFQAIMDARRALSLPTGSHVDASLIKLLPDVSKLYGAYDGSWVVVRTAAAPSTCGWTQVRQRLKISRGSISGPGYSGEVYSDGSFEMTRSFIFRHKRRQSHFEGKIAETGATGSFEYDFSDCRGDFVLLKGDVVSLNEEDFYRFDKGDRTLVRAIQDELNRLGCDVGAADGVWGGRSRRGLQAFGVHRTQRSEETIGNSALLDTLRREPDGFCTTRETAGN